MQKYYNIIRINIVLSYSEIPIPVVHWEKLAPEMDHIVQNVHLTGRKCMSLIKSHQKAHKYVTNYKMHCFHFYVLSAREFY